MVRFNIEKMKLFTLIITKDNYLEFLDSKLSIYMRAGKKDYFLQRLRSLCNIVPEFTYQPILYRWNELWRYDSEYFWQDNVGRCSLRFQNSYFGFSDVVNKFECIRIDYKSFGIKQCSEKKVKRLCGVPIDYLSAAQQKAIEEQEAKKLEYEKEWKAKREREQRIKKCKKERIKIIAKLKILENKK